MPTLAVDGIDLHYEERGRGPAIVFAHGLLWSGKMYAAQLEALSSQYRCIAYDHRGQGRSGTSPAPYDMERLTDDAEALIDRLGAAPCHFVGLSMGGFVGLRLALRRPALLRTLVLVESAADAEPRLNIPKYRAMQVVARLVGYRPLLPAVMRIMFGRAFLRDHARRAQRREQEAELLALDHARVGAALEAVVRRRPLSDEELAKITTPTLIVHGEDDRAIKIARAERTARAIPNAKLVTIEGAGHTSSVEAPAAVTRALADFFAAHP